MTSTPTTAESAAPGGGFTGFLKRVIFYIYGVCYVVQFVILELCCKFKKFDVEKIQNRSGKVVVITGGARGIGLDVVKKLLQCGLHVIMGVRKIEAGNEAINKIRQNGVTTGSSECLELDLTSLASVRNFSEAVLSRNEKIHVLINNAGIMFAPYHISKDNFESHFQVNYLSHFLLTDLLLPKMIKTAASEENGVCRVINTSSVAHYPGCINFADLQCSKFYSAHKAYYDSKLAQITSTKYLDERLQNQGAKVRVHSLHPGIIPTALWEHLGCFINAFVPCVKNMFWTTDKGANNVVYAALSPELDSEGGLFLCNSKNRRCSSRAADINIQEKLWEISMKLIGNEDNDTEEIEIVLSRDRHGLILKDWTELKWVSWFHNCWDGKRDGWVFNCRSLIQGIQKHF